MVIEVVEVKSSNHRTKYELTTITILYTVKEGTYTFQSSSKSKNYVLTQNVSIRYYPYLPFLAVIDGWGRGDLFSSLVLAVFSFFLIVVIRKGLKFILIEFPFNKR